MKLKAKKLKEFDIAANVFDELKKTLRTPILLEVPMIGRVVDLAYLKNNRVFTIEFKIKDLNKALKQAKDHLLGADFVYICVPPRKIPSEVRKLLQADGIGLMFYVKGAKKSIKTVIRAKQSKETWPVLRMDVMEYIKSGQKKYAKN